jgi:hypothetical protein
MAELIQGLIDKQDTSELIRDNIVSILASEVQSQMQLADDAGKDPLHWKLRIFKEASNPFEQWLDPESLAADKSPIVNVWYENSSFDKSGSTTIQRQFTTGTFNIDCYGCAVSSSNSAGGHNPGDREAALEAQRAVRLVRNILMSGYYVYLGLRKVDGDHLVSERFPQSITMFQPNVGEHLGALNIVGARLALNVNYNELSPQYEAVPLEYVSVEVTELKSGEVVVNADYDYTES